MDYRPTEPQRLLVAVARDFLDKACPLAVAQELAHDTRGAREELWRRVSALGWPGLLVPAPYGGSEASVLDVVLLLEEMGRAAFPSPFVTSAVVCTRILATSATRAQQERLLPAMAAGDRICALAIAGNGADGPTLDGRARFVADADVAQHLVVARESGLVVIEADRAGVTRVPLETMAGHRLCDLTFGAVELAPDDVMGSGDVLASALAAGAVARAAEMVGAAQRILELTVEHAKVRVQSGRPIGSFQAIQHACADLLRDVETARGLVHHAAWRIDTDRDAATAVAMAKGYAAQACLGVARRAHQVFGALGYSAEHPLHLLHKRIHAGAVEYGDRAAHLETVARAIGLR
ncbi:MAG: acyl-CoA/acyl-ACP dehydrogenase [Candidatus Rokubacteria bacterium]|nr:acyl-CoA/acyl-ACP dehydrogenase [Candidatus Rokubacteria bacterium]